MKSESKVKTEQETVLDQFNETVKDMDELIRRLQLDLKEKEMVVQKHSTEISDLREDKRKERKGYELELSRYRQYKIDNERLTHELNQIQEICQHHRGVPQEQNENKNRIQSTKKLRPRDVASSEGHGPRSHS